MNSVFKICVIWRNSMLLVDICAKAKVWQGTAVGATCRKQTKNRAHRLVGSFFICNFAAIDCENAP